MRWPGIYLGNSKLLTVGKLQTYFADDKFLGDGQGLDMLDTLLILPAFWDAHIQRMVLNEFLQLL